ncbi:hypothetical protein M885DRAFT_525124 [Pelagophyceae sp. CCMP2097]|nr:hypothetical protein M885DRAFT_525124 [Pelagophyceae sp. CCMP2097]|mmetsp:Transcript_9460/g.33282  ORF Transcript_9460/g.33282 Transcript_9460/m.33282 type:complete len:204 (-) Transcript_9460:41-652(-)
MALFRRPRRLGPVLQRRFQRAVPDGPSPTFELASRRRRLEKAVLWESYPRGRFFQALTTAPLRRPLFNGASRWPTFGLVGMPLGTAPSRTAPRRSPGEARRKRALAKSLVPRTQTLRRSLWRAALVRGPRRVPSKRSRWTLPLASLKSSGGHAPALATQGHLPLHRHVLRPLSRAPPGRLAEDPPRGRRREPFPQGGRSGRRK